MNRSTLLISKNNKHFYDAQNLLTELINDVTLDRWKAVESFLLEREYDGTILHTYSVFDKISNQLSQIFATNDLTEFDDRIYNCSTVKDLFVVARENGWLIRIENS
jgi:hypothetical protein